MTESAEDINFRPFTVLLGIILGTLFAIAFCTCIVGVVFWILGDEEPRLASEVHKLAEISWIFVALTLMAGFAFLGSLRDRRWRYAPLTGLWLGLILTGNYYWPT